MDRALSTRYSPLAIGVISAALFAAPSQARAQAWMPPAGVGSVSVSIQQIRNTGHLLTDGSRLDDGKSVDASIYIEAEYALTDRVSLSAGLPFVFAKYIGPGPTPFNFLPVDACHCWHGGWQDFAMTARYSVTNGWFGLAPSVSAGVPSHDYDFRGEASLGRNLKELRVAVDAGQRLDAIRRARARHCEQSEQRDPRRHFSPYSQAPPARTAVVATHAWWTPIWLASSRRRRLSR
jgi:hypothetical protein